MLQPLPTELAIISRIATELGIEATPLDGSRLLLLQLKGQTEVIDCLDLGAKVRFPAQIDIALDQLIIKDLERAEAIVKFLLRDLFPGISGERMFLPQRHVLSTHIDRDVCSFSREFQAKQPQHWFYKPVCIELELTHRCTLKCAECSIIDDVREAAPGLDVDQAISVLKQGAQIGMYAYTITGGEPFSRFADVCKIISQVPEMDCHKLQTNGTYFSSKKKTRSLLQRLKSAGFGTGNRFVRSGLHCSVGIQNYPGGAPLATSWNLIQAFKETFTTDAAQLAFILTHHHSISPEIARRDLLRELQTVADDIINEDEFHLRVVQIHRTPALAEEHDRLEKVPLGELVKHYATYWKCFDPDGIQSPYPQILVRATGDVFACSCFGHVFNLGNIKKSSLSELIEYANTLELLKMIRYEGLLGYLEYARKFAPALVDQGIAPTTTICKICGILKEIIESSLAYPAGQKRSVASSKLKIVQ